jgi:general secretion pathway protein F
MPLFDYQGINAAGKTLKGNIESESPKSARLRLKKQGLMVTHIQERTTSSKASGSPFSFIGSIKAEEVAMMIRQLASLVKANIPLVDALTAVIEQIEGVKLKTVMSQVREAVNEGIALSRAMTQHPKVFDHISINMTEAGESSGTLALVLVKLADLKEAQVRLRRKVTGAMLYPGLMAVVAVGVLIGIFTVVIPKLQGVFKSMKKKMPPLTEFLIQMSDFLVAHWLTLVIGVIAFVFLFLRYITTTKGREWWDGFKLKLPVFGKLFRFIAVTRFSSTMSTLLASGVPILTSMNIARNLVGNVLIERAIENARNNITEGQSIAEPLRRSGEFPPLVIHMISIGEKTGELPEMLKNVALSYEEQVNTAVESMTGLLEPAMIVFMGITVGTIVVSIVMPLMDMSNLNR